MISIFIILPEDPPFKEEKQVSDVRGNISPSLNNPVSEMSRIIVTIREANLLKREKYMQV